MPTYEYACRDCKQHVEVVQSFRDEPLTACPTCSGRLRKVYGATGIIFKGSGYYSTDSRASKAPKPKDEAAKDGAKEGAKATGGAADSGSASSADSGSSSEPAAKSA